jgi:5S rRNA maturation endonuclease (ribonuclease M5)
MEQERPQGEELQRELWRLVREIARLSRRCPVVVEGRRDRQALWRLGVEGEVLTLHRGKGMYEMAAELDRADELVLLLDWDARGEQLLKSLTRHLETDWETHLWLRTRLRELIGDTVVEVEHLDRVLGDPPEEGVRSEE